GPRAYFNVDPRPRTPVLRGPSLLYRTKYLKTGRRRGYHSLMATVRRGPGGNHDHATDKPRYIRQNIERGGSFTPRPGIGGMLIGSTALVAAWVASHQRVEGRWLAVWLGEAVLAMLIGIAGAELKSRRARLPLLSGPGRKFIAGFAPALAAGAVLTAV